MPDGSRSRSASDPAPVAGDFKIREKREDRDYFSMEGRKIPAGNPANPFGSVWLDLGREVCIHGSPTAAQIRSAAASASVRRMRMTCTASCRSVRRFVSFADGHRSVG